MSIPSLTAPSSPERDHQAELLSLYRQIIDVVLAMSDRLTDDKVGSNEEAAPVADAATPSVPS